MKHVRISGVHINLDEIGPVKSVKDLKKGPPIFEHLPKEDQDKAYDELWAAGYGKPDESTETPTAGLKAADAAPAVDEVK